MLGKFKDEWDLQELVTQRAKRLNLLQTPRYDHSQQMMRINNQISLKSDGSNIEGGESQIRFYNTLPSSKISPYDNLNLRDKRSRFDGGLLPHRALEQDDSESRPQHTIQRVLNFEEIEEENENLDQIKNVYYTSQNSKNSVLKALSGSKGPKIQNKKHKIRPKDKGLRQLSSRCFNIVKRQGITNYKSVAQELIQQMKQSNILNPADEKQESNVRRRVYDALNVLIAMEILKRKDKQLYFNKPNNKQKQEEKEKYRELIKKKRQALEQLREKICLMKMKNKGINQLVIRNEEQKKETMIEFPFVGIVCNNLIKSSLDFTQNNSFILKCNGPYKVFGDLEAVTHLKLGTSRITPLLNIIKQ